MSVSRIGVLGAGQMGSGIAQVSLMSSFQVVLADVSDAVLAKSRAGIGKGLDILVRKEKITSQDKERMIAGLSTTTDLAGFSSCDITVEAATEKEELKLSLFRVNNDLQNLLASVNIPIVFVSSDLRIRRFTPSAAKLLNLTPSDLDRPILDHQAESSSPARGRGARLEERGRTRRFLPRLTRGAGGVLPAPDCVKSGEPQMNADERR